MIREALKTARSRPAPALAMGVVLLVAAGETAAKSPPLPIPGIVRLKNVEFGTHYAGPVITERDLVGKVFVYEWWHPDKSECRSRVSALRSMQERYTKRQVIVAGNAMAGHTVKNIPLWGRDNPATLVKGGYLYGSYVTTDDIPYTFVFNPWGKLLFKGPAAEADAVIEQAVSRTLGHYLADRDYAKFDFAVEKLTRMRHNLSPTLIRLRTEAADEENEAARRSEARHILDRVAAWSRNRYQQYSADPAQDAIYNLDAIRHIMTLLRGDELGKPWVELEQMLSTDGKFRDELAAAHAYEAVKTNAIRMLDFCHVSIRRRPDAFNKLKATIRKQVDKGVKMYPGTVGAARMEALRSEYGL